MQTMGKIVFSKFLFLFPIFAYTQIPSLYFPKKGTTITTDYIKFDWQKNPFSTLIEVQLDADSLFQNPNTLLLDFDDSVTGLQSDKKYFFRWRIPNLNWSDYSWFKTSSFSSLASIQLWLSADEGVLLENNVVKHWKSKDVNQTLLLRNSPFNAPEFTADFLNGKPAISFGKTVTAPSMTFLDFPAISVNGNIATTFL